MQTTQRQRLAIAIALIIGCVVGITAPSLYRTLTNHTTAIDAESLLKLTQEVSAMGTATVGSSEKAANSRDFAGAIANGEPLICSDYVRELQRSLWQKNIASEGYAVGISNIALLDDAPAIEGFSHVILSVGDYVADPTAGIVYLHSMETLIREPYLADEYIGTPNPIFATNVGARFFSALNRVINERDMHGTSLQNMAQINIKRGIIKNGALPFIFDNNFNTPTSFTADNHALVLDFSYPTGISAKSIIIVPDWSRFTPPEVVTVRALYRGDATPAIHTLDGRKDYRIGGYYVMLNETKTLEYIEVAMSGFKEANQNVAIAEIGITGYTDNGKILQGALVAGNVTFIMDGSRITESSFTSYNHRFSVQTLLPVNTHLTDARIIINNKYFTHPKHVRARVFYKGARAPEILLLDGQKDFNKNITFALNEYVFTLNPKKLVERIIYEFDGFPEAATKFRLMELETTPVQSAQ